MASDQSITQAITQTSIKVTKAAVMAERETENL